MAVSGAITVACNGEHQLLDAEERPADGSSIYNEGNLTLEDEHRDSLCHRGGIVSLGQLTVNRSTIADNHSAGFGGVLVGLGGAAEYYHQQQHGLLVGGGIVAGICAPLHIGRRASVTTITDNSAVGEMAEAYVFGDGGAPTPFCASNTVIAGNTD